jgi:hypothetical protein
VNRNLEALDDCQRRTVTVDSVRDLNPHLSAILELPCRDLSDSGRARRSGCCRVQVKTLVKHATTETIGNPLKMRLVFRIWLIAKGRSIHLLQRQSAFPWLPKDLRRTMSHARRAISQPGRAFSDA